MCKKEFRRSPSSGAIGTTSKIAGLQGDIIRADLYPIPYIECKKYKDFRLENFLLQQGEEWAWVDQTLKNLKGQQGRVWVIIFQKDYGRQHWCLTNFYIEEFPRFLLATNLVQTVEPLTLTTLDIAFKDPRFKGLFTNDIR